MNFKKNNLCTFLLLFFVNSVILPIGENRDLYDLSASNLKTIDASGFKAGFKVGENIFDLKKVDIDEFKSGGIAFTKVGKEVFEEFLKVKDFDMSFVRQLLNRHSGSKFYHLYSAYCYGFYVWQNTSSPYEKEVVRRAVWNIAMEFSQQNNPRWEAYFFKLFPMFSWTTVAVFAIILGCYLKKNEKILFDKFGGSALSFFLKLIESTVKDDKKGSTGK